MTQQLEMTRGMDKRWTITGLPADHPDPKMQEKLHLFGQFVGDWDILEERYLQPDGTWSKTTKGELHWNWILEGKGVQDVWSDIDEKTGQLIPVGTTVRFYDPKIDAWHSVWISPVQGTVKEFIGRKVGDEAVLETKSKEGYPTKWIFSEITPNSFRWRAEESLDEGKTWRLKEEMRIRRQGY